jgi:hypothetical protein
MPPRLRQSPFPPLDGSPFNDLPEELLLKIVEYVDTETGEPQNRVQLYNICLVNSRCRRITQPLLFANITIDFKHWEQLILPWGALIRTLQHRPDLAKHVQKFHHRSLTFVASAGTEYDISSNGFEIVFPEKFCDLGPSTDGSILESALSQLAFQYCTHLQSLSLVLPQHVDNILDCLQLGNTLPSTLNEVSISCRRVATGSYNSECVGLLLSEFYYLPSLQAFILHGLELSTHLSFASTSSEWPSDHSNITSLTISHCSLQLIDFGLILKGAKGLDSFHVNNFKLFVDDNVSGNAIMEPLEVHAQQLRQLSISNWTISKSDAAQLHAPLTLEQVCLDHVPLTFNNSPVTFSDFSQLRTVMIPTRLGNTPRFEMMLPNTIRNLRIDISSLFRQWGWEAGHSQNSGPLHGVKSMANQWLTTICDLLQPLSSLVRIDLYGVPENIVDTILDHGPDFYAHDVELSVDGGELSWTEPLVFTLFSEEE